jgi:hypothetical protein
MSQEYATPKNAAHTLVAAEAHSPALTDADEEFLKRITSGEENDTTQQVVIYDDKGNEEALLAEAEQVALPVSPPAVEEKKTPEQAKEEKQKGIGNKISSVFTSIRSNVPISFGKVCM